MFDSMQLTYDYAPGDHKLDDSLPIQVSSNGAPPEVIKLFNIELVMGRVMQFCCLDWWLVFTQSLSLCRLLLTCSISLLSHKYECFVVLLILCTIQATMN